MKDLCPLCKQKGKLIEDQFNRILYCDNQSCAILQYRAIEVLTAL